MRRERPSNGMKWEALRLFAPTLVNRLYVNAAFLDTLWSKGVLFNSEKRRLKVSLASLLKRGDF